MPKLGVLDPSDRFVALANRVSWGRAHTAVSPAVLENIIRSDNPASVRQSLARHIALNTTLTELAAAELVKAGFARAGGDQEAMRTPEETARVLSDATSAAAPTFAGELELSDPMMLGPWARILAALVMALGLILSIVFVSTLDTKSTNWAYGSLALLGIGCLLGIVILIMGYKNVTIKGTGGTPGSSTTGGSGGQ